MFLLSPSVQAVLVPCLLLLISPALESSFWELLTSCNGKSSLVLILSAHPLILVTSLRSQAWQIYWEGVGLIGLTYFAGNISAVK